MKEVTDLFVVCKYERWSQYWFKALLNYILVNESSKVVAQYNSRNHSITLSEEKKLFTVKFVSESWMERGFDGHNCKVIDWYDGEEKDLYLKIKEAMNG